MERTTTPSITQTSFVCPHCDAFAAQIWSQAVGLDYNGPPPATNALKKKSPVRLGNFVHEASGFTLSQVDFARCHHCDFVSIWAGGQMVYPPTGGIAVKPNPDLNVDIQQDFEEARQIVLKSPRGAAALLRLAVQKLCKQLGEAGKNIDQDIGNLVGKGLDPLLQMSLDAVRVIGNEQVHPGELDLRDDLDTAVYLFELVNSIADQMLTRPKAIKATYAKLPQSKRDAIDARNAAAIDKAGAGKSQS